MKTKSFLGLFLLTPVSCSILSGCGAGLVPTQVSNDQAAGLIQHVVVIFPENVSFDHYFGTYPLAANTPGETSFTALAGTPAVNGLTSALLTQNPNASNLRNGSGAVQPFRLPPSLAAIADQDHNYLAEERAFDGGGMDLFPLSVGAAETLHNVTGPAATTGLTMGYYDGNTVTGLWNYAQKYSMSDHFFETTFGPSTTGALNLISGTTNGAVNDSNATGVTVSDGNSGLTLIGDADPVNDVCSSSSNPLVHMTGTNIGDLLNAKGVSWGFFAEGFDLTVRNADGSIACARTTTSAVTGVQVNDYIPHHQPFQYYASTGNPTHVRPASPAVVGKAGDSTNHQYDLNDFFSALAAGNFPKVSFLKPAGFHDGHAGYSDPLDEQQFLVNTINVIQKTPQWSSTVVIIVYDDSDGWYDHVANVINGSETGSDAYTKAGKCLTSNSTLPGVNPTTLHAQGRCGYGPRLPELVISPWAKPNFVDSTVTDQTSVTRFIEDVFLNGQRIGQGSFDGIANSIENMLDFSKGAPQNSGVFLLNVNTGVVTH